MSSNTFDLIAAFKMALTEHKREVLADVEKIVRSVVEEHLNEKWLTRQELAEHLGYANVGAMNTAWCRARKKGNASPIELAGVEVNGSKRWRRATVDALLATQAA